MKKNRTLALLGVLFAVLVAIVLWDRRRPSTDEQKHTAARILPDFSRAKATALQLARRDGRMTQLVHEASGWWLLSPRERADDDRLESLLSVLELGQIERHVGQGDPAQFGLAPPLVTVRVQDHELRIGGDSPGRGVYLQRDGSPEILVAEHRLVEVADLDPALWLSSRLTLTDPAAAARIGFGDWTLARDRGWRVTAPAIVRASQAKVDALVQSLARARGHHRTDVAVRDGAALTVDGREEAGVGGACPGEPRSLAVWRADAVGLCFAASDLDTLRAPVTTLYERRLFPLRLDDVIALDVTTAGRVLSLRRQDGVWRVTAPLSSVGPASDEKVRALVQQLVEAQARGFTKDAPAGAIVRVRLGSADETIAAELSSAHGLGVARREGETLSLEIDSSRVEALANAEAGSLRKTDGGAR